LYTYSLQVIVIFTRSDNGGGAHYLGGLVAGQCTQLHNHANATEREGERDGDARGIVLAISPWANTTNNNTLLTLILLLPSLLLLLDDSDLFLGDDSGYERYGGRNLLPHLLSAYRTNINSRRARPLISYLFVYMHISDTVVFFL